MKTLARIFVVALAPLALTAHAQTGPPTALSPREELGRLASELNRWPHDHLLRERIMKLAQGVKPLPAIPDEAKRAFFEGEAIRKRANVERPAELKGAVEAYKRATTLAPWWPEPYYYLGVVQSFTNSLAAADQSFGIFLLSKPGADQAEQARDEIIKIEAEEEVMSRQVASGSITAEALLDALDGASYDCPSRDPEVLNLFLIQGRGLSYKQVFLRPFDLSKDLLVADRARDRQGLTFWWVGNRNNTQVVSPRQVEWQTGGSKIICRRIRGSR